MLNEVLTINTIIQNKQRQQQMSWNALHVNI